MGKTPQSEADRKQAGWGENQGNRKIPQLEDREKKVDWGENQKTERFPQFGEWREKR